MTSLAHDPWTSDTATMLAASLIRAVGIRPTCIFAAGRRSFEIEASAPSGFDKGHDEQSILRCIFTALPLRENGWAAARITHVNGNRWRVERVGDAI